MDTDKKCKKCGQKYNPVEDGREINMDNNMCTNCDLEDINEGVELKKGDTVFNKFTHDKGILEVVILVKKYRVKFDNGEVHIYSRDEISINKPRGKKAYE